MKHLTHDRSLDYRGEIDGLRGIAVLAVLLHHVDPHLLPGGYVGVDVFFVISGFLITSILSRDIASGAFSFSNFYARRVKRLMPAGTVMVVIVMGLAALFFLPFDFRNLGATAVAYAGMVSNFLFWKWDDYFASQNKVWPLLHTWSLAVEEQFYLLYPLILWGVSGRRRAQLRILVGIAVVSFGISVYQTVVFPRAAYYLLPARAWELTIGCLCAMAPPVRPRGAVWPMIASGSSLMIVLPMLLFSHRTPFPGWLAAFPVIGTALVIWVTGSGGGLLRSVLQLPWLVGVGQISYSLYLWHWPLLILAKYPWSATLDGPPAIVPYLAAVASFPIAWLSYRFVETPARKSAIGDTAAIRGAFVAAAATAILGLVVHQTHGLSARLPRQAVAYDAGAADINPGREELMLPTSRVQDGGARLGADNVDIVPSFALWGDSFADAIAPALDEIARRKGVAGQGFARHGTPPVMGVEVRLHAKYPTDHEFTAAVLERLTREPNESVVLVANWNLYVSAADLLEDGKLADTRDRRITLLQRGLRRVIRALRNAGTKHVWIVSEPPAQPFHVPKQLAMNAAWKRLWPQPAVRGLNQQDFASTRIDIDQMLRECVGDGVGIIDLAAAICALKGKLVTEEDRPLYYDHAHLSASGARAVEWAFDPIFTELNSQQPASSPTVSE